MILEWIDLDNLEISLDELLNFIAIVKYDKNTFKIESSTCHSLKSFPHPFSKIDLYSRCLERYKIKYDHLNYGCAFYRSNKNKSSYFYFIANTSSIEIMQLIERYNKLKGFL